jgi:hypothetical protein
MQRCPKGLSQLGYDRLGCGLHAIDGKGQIVRFHPSNMGITTSCTKFEAEPDRSQMG